MALIQERRNIKNLRPPSLSVNPRPLLFLQTIPNSTAAATTTTFTSSSSTAPISASDLERLQFLGHGSGGTVHKVLHKPPSTAYALKQLKPTATDDNNHNNTLETELAILRRTSASPYVVNCHAIFESPAGDVSVLMEYMDTGSLEILLKSQGPFSEERLAPVARQVLQGLDCLHNTHKVVHLDIKPANLLTNTKNEVKIADFGCSEIITSSSCRSSYVGTCAYMSPERFDRERYGGRYSGFAGDIWSFGVTVMELYLGHFPLLPKGETPEWASLMCAICFGGAPCLPEEGGASEELGSFDECCMHREASKRWTAAQLLTHPFVCKSHQSDDECKQQNLAGKKRNREVEQCERSKNRSRVILYVSLDRVSCIDILRTYNFVSFISRLYISIQEHQYIAN